MSGDSNEANQKLDTAAEAETSGNIPEVISEVSAAIFNLQNEITQLSKMIQKNAKWSTNRKIKLKIINQKIDKCVHALHDCVTKIISYN
jgi:hypothetical protein